MTSSLTLFKATMNSVSLILNRFRDSMVCGSNPCIMSTTKIARSHKLEPLDRRFVKDSWPGVSITNRPGTLSFRTNKEEEHLDFVVSSLKTKRKMKKARFETMGRWNSNEEQGFSLLNPKSPWKGLSSTVEKRRRKIN